MKIPIIKIPEISQSTQLLFVIYGLISIKLNMLDYSLVPDEITFMRIAIEMPWLQNPSPEYFGQIFWILLKGISKIVPSFIFGEVAKILFGGLLFLSLLSCIIFCEKKENGFYCTALALTSPLFYWSGKIIGPDVLAVSLIFFALALHSKNKDGIAFLLIGVAVGVKLVVFPALIYIIFSKFLKIINAKSFIFCLILFCLGFFIANPTDNYSLIIRLMEIRRSTSEIGFESYIQNFSVLWDLVFKFRADHNWTWDLIPSNTFQDLSFSWFACFLILFGALISSKKLFLSYLVFLIGHFVWVIKGNAGIGFPWYWMSIAPVSIHVFSRINLSQKIFNTKYLSKINLGVAIILCSFVQSSSVVVAQVHQKQYQKQNISDFSDDYNCFLSTYKTDNLKVVTRVSLEPNKVSIYDNYYASVSMYDNYEIPITFKENFYLLISSRFFYADTPSQNILKNDNKLLGRCGDILIFKIFSNI